MTDREKAIVMAHTGICMLTGDKFQIFHKYIEDIMGRPIMTHEIGLLADSIKEKSKADFLALCAEQEPTTKNDLAIDCVSRQAIDGYIDYILSHGMGKKKSFDFIKKFVANLPSVTPQEPTGNDVVLTYDAYYDLIANRAEKLEQEPCEDAISRILKRMWNCRGKHTTSIDKVKMEQILRDELPSVKPQEPTTKNDLGVNCIDRAKAQTAIEMNAFRYTLTKERGGTGQVEWSDQLIKVNDAVDIIRNLPSVTPRPKTGYWIEHPHEAGLNWEYSRYECSECHVWSDDDSDYCPNCGCKDD